MDKRLIKSQHAIYDGFTKVLNEREYSTITVEDILNNSGVSRSTFYAHFKTKDDVLLSVNNRIFSHVFSHTLTEEKTHDFSHDSLFEYSHLITHILYHLHDEKILVAAILNNSTKTIFFSNMKDKFEPVARMIVSSLKTNPYIPPILYIEKVTDLFINVIAYWFSIDCKDSPEKMSSYFFELIK